MKTITVAKSFTLTLSDNKKRVMPLGTYEVEAAVADHWYTQAHLTGARLPAPTPGTHEFAVDAREKMKRAIRNEIETDVRREMEPKLRAELTDIILAEVRAEFAAVFADTQGSAVAPEKVAEIIAKTEADAQAALTQSDAPPADGETTIEETFAALGGTDGTDAPSKPRPRPVKRSNGDVA